MFVRVEGDASTELPPDFAGERRTTPGMGVVSLDGNPPPSVASPVSRPIVVPPGAPVDAQIDFSLEPAEEEPTFGLSPMEHRPALTPPPPDMPVASPPTGRITRRGLAPVYEGRSRSPSNPSPNISVLERSTLEGLPSTPPLNAVGITSFPSPLPPAPQRAPSSEVAALIERAIEKGEGSREAVEALLQRGGAALPEIGARFPGPIEVDRHRVRDLLPAASQCGPLLALLAAMQEQALPLLADQVDAPEVEPRFWATHLLAEIRSAAAARLILPRLFDEDTAVRRIAHRSAAALAASGEPRETGEAGAPVLQGLEDLGRDPGQPAARRLLAIEAMGEIRAGAPVPTLIALLDDAADEIADAARRALLLITRQDFGREAPRWQEWWSANAGRHRVEWLIDALMHEQPSLRRAAGDELKLVTKEYLGYYDDLPKEGRERAQGLYRAWWEREGRLKRG
jgi:hypothetical protein